MLASVPEFIEGAVPRCSLRVPQRPVTSVPEFIEGASVMLASVPELVEGPARLANPGRSAQTPLDQSELLSSAPSLYLFLTDEGCLNAVGLFGEYELHRQSLLREVRTNPLVVLPESTLVLASMNSATESLSDRAGHLGGRGSLRGHRR